MEVSASAWLAVTSAPGVTVDRLMRPLMGASMRLYLRLMRAVSRLALATATSERDWAAAAWLSSKACWLMASILTSSALRRAVASSVRALASALARAAWALASVARSEAASIW